MKVKHDKHKSIKLIENVGIEGVEPWLDVWRMASTKVTAEGIFPTRMSKCKCTTIILVWHKNRAPTPEARIVRPNGSD